MDATFERYQGRIASAIFRQREIEQPLFNIPGVWHSRVASQADRCIFETFSKSREGVLSTRSGRCLSELRR